MLLYSLDLLGTVVFAISGAWLACRKEMDIFGAMVLAFVTAAGGGTIRDVLLGSIPVFWIEDTLYVMMIIAATALSILLREMNQKLEWPMQVLDALGLAVFVVIGVSKALSFSVEPVIAIMMGVLTGCGGGVIRDVLADDVPTLLRKEIYAGAALAGGLIYVTLDGYLGDEITAVITTIAVLFMRLLSVYKGLSLPKFIVR